MQPTSRRLPEDLNKAAEEFRLWRSTPARGRRIPEDLWQLACQLAKTYGVSRTSQILKLDYYALKRRIDPESIPGYSVSKRARQAKSKPAFIELGGLPMSATTECDMECDDGQGARFVFRWKGSGAPDVASLSENFWNGR